MRFCYEIYTFLDHQISCLYGIEKNLPFYPNFLNIKLIVCKNPKILKFFYPKQVSKNKLKYQENFYDFVF